MKQYTIDRLEEGFAVCEALDRSTVSIPLSQLPDNSREGDCLIVLEDGSFQLDDQATAARRAKLAKLQNSLFE